MKRIALALLGLIAAILCVHGQSTVFWKVDYITDANGVVIAVARPAPGDVTPPTQPSGLNCVTTSTSIQLSWSPSTDGGSGVAQYKIYRGSLPIGSTASTSYTDSIRPDTTYTYTVLAMDYAGNHSTASTACSFNTGPGPWMKIGGASVLHSWPALSGFTVESLHAFDNKLYAGFGSTTNAAMLFEFNPATQRWRKMGGGKWITTGSWGAGYEAVTSIADLDGKLYAGLGTGTNDAEVWELDFSTLVWTQIGGDGFHSSWTGFESVRQLAVISGKLYAGLGNTGSNAEVWQYDPSTTTWAKIGAGANAPWPTGRESVRALTVLDGKLYAGLGDTGSDATVWQWDPSSTTWTKIGDGGNAPWPSNREQVQSLAALDGKLYAGLGNTGSDAAVWQWNPSTSVWTKRGGDGVNSSWPTGGAYETVRSLLARDGRIYAGLGGTSGDAEIWQYTPSSTSWAKVAGDGFDSAWSTNTAVSAMESVNGELTVGLPGPEVWIATVNTYTDQTHETVEETDDFTYSNGNIGTIIAPWVLRGNSGSWSVSNNKLRFSTLSTAATSWRGALDTWSGPASAPTVLFAEVKFMGSVGGSWGNGGAGPGVLYADTSTSDQIIAFERMRIFGGDYQVISSRPATGSQTDLWSASTSLIASGDVMRIEVWHGSFAIAKRNGTILATVRFIPSAGGLRVGMVGQSVGSGSPYVTVEFDDWQAGIID